MWGSNTLALIRKIPWLLISKHWQVRQFAKIQKKKIRHKRICTSALWMRPPSEFIGSTYCEKSKCDHYCTGEKKCVISIREVSKWEQTNIFILIRKPKQNESRQFDNSLFCALSCCLNQKMFYTVLLNFFIALVKSDPMHGKCVDVCLGGHSWVLSRYVNHWIHLHFTHIHLDTTMPCKKSWDIMLIEEDFSVSDIFVFYCCFLLLCGPN